MFSGSAAKTRCAERATHAGPGVLESLGSPPKTISTNA